MKIKQISALVFAGILLTTSVAFAKSETTGQGQQTITKAVMSASP